MRSQRVTPAADTVPTSNLRCIHNNSTPTSNFVQKTGQTPSQVRRLHNVKHGSLGTPFQARRICTQRRKLSHPSYAMQSGIETSPTPIHSNLHPKGGSASLKSFTMTMTLDSVPTIVLYAESTNVKMAPTFMATCVLVRFPRTPFW